MEFYSNPPIVSCDVCGYQYIPAKSKRELRCPNCAHIEKHGESIFATKKRKQKEQRMKWQKKAVEKQRLNPPPPRQKIAAMSKKGKIAARKVSEMKADAKTGAADGDYVQCKGCKKHFQTIDASHKVPLSQSLALAANPENITLLCRDCHLKWENGTVPKLIELDCFVDDMHYLFDADPERFWKIFYRCLDEYEKSPTPKLGRIISKLELLDTYPA